MQTVPGWNREIHLFCSWTDNVSVTISQTFIPRQIRFVCRLRGGTDTFGSDPEDIGNRSLRSGAAMALSLSRYHPFNIMIVGCWKSTAFMQYIWSQVLEWTNNVSKDMARVLDFRDVPISTTNNTSKRRNRCAQEDAAGLTPEFFLGH